ncbi:MAG: hypothetical protein ACKPKT_17980, partial [Dolichospermum sp.]
METKFSPNLLDNDPNFEHKPGKVIKVNSQAWFDWLSANDSFRFIAGNNSYRARKEFNQAAKIYYWYGVKKVNGKLHKKFIGKSDAVTHARLIEISSLIMQPSQPRNPQRQETITAIKETSAPDLMELIQSLSLRLDNLEKKQVIENAEVFDVKGFEDAIARLKDELANKDMQLPKLTNQLHDKDMQLSELTNQLHDKDMQLSELTNQLHDKDMQLSELTNELYDKNMQLSELTNKLANKDSQLQDLKSVPVVLQLSINEQLTTDNYQLPEQETGNRELGTGEHQDVDLIDSETRTDTQSPMTDNQLPPGDDLTEIKSDNSPALPEKNQTDYVQKQLKKIGIKKT